MPEFVLDKGAQSARDECSPYRGDDGGLYLA